MTKIRTEIFIESNESVTIKKKRYSVRTFCDECQRISIMVLPSEAAFLSCKDIDSIISLMYENYLHLKYLEARGLLICLTSLCLYGFENESINNEFGTLKIFTDVKKEEIALMNEE